MPRPMGGWLLFLALLAALLGCERLDLAKGRQNLLRPTQMSPQSVGLEIIFVRCKTDDEALGESLWSEIDEQRLSAETRRQLDANGFRVGVVGTNAPSALEKLLNSKPLSAPASTTTSPVPQAAVAALDGESLVTGRRLQIKAGSPTEIQTSQVYDELPLLVRRDGELVGQTVKKAQGVLVLKAFHESGGVKLEVVPQVQFGDPVQSIAPSDEGVWKFEAGRKREIFDALSLAATLTPGQMLICTCLPDRTGSLGHQFFTHRTNGPVEQKILLIRVSQTLHGE